MIVIGFKEKSIVKEIKLIELKLKRQNVSERIIDMIKILSFTNVSCKCTGLYDIYLDFKKPNL